MSDRAGRVAVGGPLSPYADGFRGFLTERGYRSSSAAGQLQLMAHLSRWLADRGGDDQDLTVTVVEEFLATRRSAGYRQWRSVRGMSPLLDYLGGVGLGAAQLPGVSDDEVEVLLAGYEAYLVVERGLAASTVRNYLAVGRQFACYRCGTGRLGLQALTAAEVSDFVVTGCRTGGAGSATLLTVGMRALLGYLHRAGITPHGLVDAVPAAASWPASRLLRSCDRRTSVGRRDFAVLTMLLRLGLRVGEVAAVELHDIDWRRGELLVHGKGRREDRLPLPPDVGEAVAGWLRRGRTPCSSTRLFTTVLAPRGGLTGKAVSAIVRRSAHRAGVAVTAHQLRHTAATQLLRAGASLPEVGQVLRHASLLSTAIYAKVDHASLSVVARPWPVSAR